MINLTGALWAETRKLRRSKISTLSLIVAAVIPTMIAFFMKILIDPSWAAHFGVITAKAQATGVRADWTGYFSMLTQAVAVGGLLLFGILVTWIFGREFSDRTMRDLLALPVGRWTIVTAKLVVVAVWSFVLATIVFAVAVGLGALLALPKWTAALLVEAGGRYLAVAALTIGLTVPFGLAATIGRGYLPAVGAMFAVLILSQFLAALGLGAWFPWAVPALISGAAGSDTAMVGTASVSIVAATTAAASVITVVWWNTADQT